MVFVPVGIDANSSLPAAVKTRLAAEAADPTSTLGASLSGTIATAVNPVQSVGYLGDSLSIASAYVFGSNANWAGVARSLLGNRYAHGIQAGVGGETSAQILARVGTVVAARPTFCIFEAGVNSIAASVSAESVIADLTAIIDALIAGGVVPIVQTLTPSVNITGARLTEAGKVNNWIKALPVTRGVNVIDWCAAVVDFSSTTAQWVSAWTADGVHPNEQGHVIMGQAVARVLEPLIMGTSPLVSNAGAGGQGLISANPGMTGSGGTAGTGVTGTIPASWTVNGTTTTAVSVEPRTDDVGGNWMRLAITDGQPQIFIQNTAVGVDWNVGDEAWAEVEILMLDTPTNLRGFSFRLDFWSGIGSASNSTLNMPPVIALPLRGRPKSFVLKTTPTIIPASTARLQLFLLVNQSVASQVSTIRLGRMCIRKSV